MYLWRGGYNLIQILDDVIALRFWDANDLGDEAGIEEEGFPSCDGVRAYQRMFGGDWLTANSAAELSRPLRLQIGRMDSGKAFQVRLHGFGELVIGSVLRGPEGVASTAAWWTRENFE